MHEKNVTERKTKMKLVLISYFSALDMRNKATNPAEGFHSGSRDQFIAGKIHFLKFIDVLKGIYITYDIYYVLGYLRLFKKKREILMPKICD